MDQKEIGVLDRGDMDNFADIFVDIQIRGKSQDKHREFTLTSFRVKYKAHA
jgi:hypothetical protein